MLQVSRWRWLLRQFKVLVAKSVLVVRGRPPEIHGRSATVKFRFLHRNGCGVFKQDASADAGARATEWVVMLIAMDWNWSLPATNHAMHRMPKTLLRAVFATGDGRRYKSNVTNGAP